MGMGTTLAWMESCNVVPASSLTWQCLDHAWRVATYDVDLWEAMVQQNPCTEKCDVGIPLRPYLSRRLHDKPSCLVFKGGNVDLLFDE